MNFLLHRHLAARDLGEAAGIGAMLPDLWRMADRRVRPARDVRPDDAPPILRDVLAGIAHHVAADHAFHTAPVFVDGEQRTLAAIRDARIDAPKLGLFAHVIWEMCLDGALLRREGLDEVLAALRRSFDETSEAAADAADLHHWSRHCGDARRAAFSKRMAYLTAEIARGPWIAGYRDGLGVALRTEGIRVRVGLPSLGSPAIETLGEALENVTRAADGALDVLLRQA